MSRVMIRPDTGTKVKVYQHIITRNHWEYYVLDPKPDSRQNVFAVVMGFETEMGQVHLPEVAKHVISVCSGTDLNDIAPAEGWEWE